MAGLKGGAQGPGKLPPGGLQAFMNAGQDGGICSLGGMRGSHGHPACERGQRGVEQACSRLDLRGFLRPVPRTLGRPGGNG